MKEHRAVRRSGSFYVLLAVAVSLLAPVRAAASGAESETDSLEEVIVTARKIRENVHDIPLSVQVLTGEQLDEADLSRLFDLQHHVPGLVLNTFGMYGAGFSLRGVSDQGGMHLNGVYLGHSHLAIARSFDLDRIEVLKGPQGTLYGRNANGGSINFITRVAEDEFGGELESAFGSFDTTRLQGHLNVPLGSAAMRLAFIGSDGDGYIRNSVDDRRFGEADYWGLRGSLAVEPNERWRIDLTAQRVYDDGASAELWLPNPAYLPDPGDIHLTTVTLADPFLRIENDFASLTAEYDLGFASARSITGYARNETHNLDDCQGLPRLLSCIRGGDPLIYEQWSQELQLASTNGERIDWLAGLYYFSGESREHFFRLQPLTSPRPLENFHSTADNTAWALFSHANLHLGGGWGVSGGLRYSDEDNEVSRIGSGVLDEPELVVAAGSWDQPSWRLDLEYAARDGLLYYAGLSTGFRSGGVTTRRVPTGEFNRYDPEDLLAFEAGMKSQWPELGLTLDAAAFHYDFDNLQTTNRYFVGEDVFVEIDNAAEAEVYGIDAVASLQAAERLSLAAAFVWLPKREYVEFVTRNGEDLSGYELPRAPEWSMIGSLTYRRPLAHYGEFTTRLEYSYRSGFFYTLDNVATESQGAYGLLNLLLRFEPAQANWYAFATGRNLTDEDYFHQVFIQSTPGYPDTYEVGVGIRF
ncbi:MAG: TonB-dependent receptor [Lysobacterales bacterium]